MTPRKLWLALALLPALAACEMPASMADAEDEATAAATSADAEDDLPPGDLDQDQEQDQTRDKNS